jgi:hypothetical protein
VPAYSKPPLVKGAYQTVEVVAAETGSVDQLVLAEIVAADKFLLQLKLATSRKGCQLFFQISILTKTYAHLTNFYLHLF